MTPEQKNGIQTVYSKSRKQWRNWLDKNHSKKTSVWLIIYKKQSEIPSVYYAEAVEEALCFGWIDSKANKRDEESYYQFFARRNPKSNWSTVNKKRIEALMDQGLVRDAGLHAIEIAKQNGTWIALDEIDKGVIPEDLQQAFNKSKKALKNFEAFSPSSKKGILEWIHNAKRPETRLKRIQETVSLAASNIKANQWVK